MAADGPMRPTEPELPPLEITSESLDSSSLPSDSGVAGFTPPIGSPSQPGEETLNTSQAPPAPESRDVDPAAPPNRDRLIQKARHFLLTSDVRYQDDDRKRFFLLGKGLDPDDVSMLLNEIALPPPPLPPRTYPGATKRTDWLALLLSVSRVLAYLSGASAAMLFMYYRILLPRINAGLEARHLLQLQGTDSLKGLRDRVESIKQQLPPIVRPDSEVEASSAAESSAQNDDATIDTKMEVNPPESGANDGSLAQNSKTDDLAVNLSMLASTIHSIRFARQINRDKSDTLQSLANLTGFISSRIHYRSYADAMGTGMGAKRPSLGPVEDEVRSEIRALKGLALNR
ncbi:hypothetical protein FRB97_006087 [Tulasnella sp. 331]|nr:hypothetical protein FRB97_006087 [Tulasnella sp. 331]